MSTCSLSSWGWLVWKEMGVEGWRIFFFQWWIFQIFQYLKFNISNISIFSNISNILFSFIVFPVSGFFPFHVYMLLDFAWECFKFPFDILTAGQTGSVLLPEVLGDRQSPAWLVRWPWCPFLFAASPTIKPARVIPTMPVSNCIPALIISFAILPFT